MRPLRRAFCGQAHCLGCHLPQAPAVSLPTWGSRLSLMVLSEDASLHSVALSLCSHSEVILVYTANPRRPPT